MPISLNRAALCAGKSNSGYRLPTQRASSTMAVLDRHQRTGQVGDGLQHVGLNMPGDVLGQNLPDIGEKEEQRQANRSPLYKYVPLYGRSPVSIAQ